MNKADLIEAVAIKCDISKLAAQRAVDAMIDTITNSLQNGKEVQLLGFGTFSICIPIKSLDGLLVQH